MGNLEDITLRVLRILKEVHLIAAEDTRHSKKLLNHFAIDTPMISYHQHSGSKQVDKIISSLEQGKDVALISDAGTPGISDPGQELIARCVEQQITVDSLPGANAAITALAASAFPLAAFTFQGFLPRKGMKQAVQAILEISHPVVIYESPYRIEETVKALSLAMPQREVFLAREISKMHQQYIRGSLAQVAQETPWEQVAKGEFVLILGPGEPRVEQPLSEDDLAAKVADLLAQGMSPRDVARKLSQDTGIARREIYTLANHKKNQDGI